MKKFIFSSLFLSVAFAINVKAQHSIADNITQTPPKVIFKKTFNSPGLKNQEVQIVMVPFAPGEVSGAHRHPVETIAYVLEGEIESTFNGKVHRYKQGDVFYENPNLLHAESKNLSATKNAKLLVFFIGKSGKPFIIPASH
jgi:quercetin dioxygenase-like cupin family protein